MVIVNEFNFFYIQLFDLGEYIYMKESSYCKYDKMLYVLIIVQWWIFFVYEMNGEGKKDLFCFILCIIKWLGKFFYMDKLFFECVKGLENNLKFN